MVDVERAISELLARGEARARPSAAVARRLAALLPGGDFVLAEVVRLVSSDPGTAAQVLGAAAARTGGEAPASIPLAVERIGEAELIRIAREAAAANSEDDQGPFAAFRRDAWREALGAAVVCRELALARGLDGDEAWLCGLLHDVGRLAAVSAVERLAAGARQAPGAAGWRWERLVERWHVSLGASVASGLGFPRAVLDAIFLHHDVQVAAGRSTDLIRIVRTADAIVGVLRDRPEAGGDAEALEDLTDAEAARLAPVIGALQSMVGAIEGAPGPDSHPGAGSAGPVRAAPPLHESKGPGVRLRMAGREYTAASVGPHQLVVFGPAPLGEGALLEVEQIERRGVAFHARVLLSWQDGDQFGAIVMPFSLSGPAMLDWKGAVPVGATA